MRFSDTDAMGHVNHARFLSYLEDARIALLAASATDDRGLQVSGVILARLEIDYRRPILLEPAHVSCEVWITGIGTASVEMAYRLRQGAEVAAEASSVLVAYDYAQARSRPLTAAERDGLMGHLVPAAPAG
ncbi:MAG: acyl-CoA thioesterase [Candidatus Dormibacteria bacterium]